MADYTRNVGGGEVEKFVDQADGTVAKKVALAGTASGDLATLTAQNVQTAHLAAIEVATESIDSKVISTVAHDAVDSGNPLKIGLKAIAGMSGLTLVAAADRTDAFAGLDGAQYVRTQCGLEDIVAGTASNTDGTVTTVIAAAGAGIKQYLSLCVITNMHASTTAYVELYSGAVSRFILPVPPGGVVCKFDPPLPPNAANETWRFDPSAAVTTLYCSLLAFKSKI